MYRGTAVACALIVSCAAPAFAQAPNVPTGSARKELDHWALGFSLDLRTPTGSFADHVSEGGAGGKMAVDRQLGHSIFSLGGEVGWLLYGEEKSPYSGTDVFGKTLTSATTDNTVITYNTLVRARRRGGKWQPFADAVLGGNWFRTTTSLDGAGFDICTLNGCTSIGDETSTQLSDSVLVYGGGAGLMRTLTAAGGVLFDFSVRYLHGGNARYLTEGAIQREGNTIVQMDVAESSTNTVAAYFGLEWGHGGR
jgi:hypothetical protein